MSIEDEELLNEFVVESQEHLADVELHLLTLESNPNSVDVPLINKVFRAIHSIKGVAGFLGLETVETLAHREEEVLNRLRYNEILPSSEVVNTLLRATDRLKGLLDSLETSNQEDISELVTALELHLPSPADQKQELPAEELFAAELLAAQSIASPDTPKEPASTNSEAHVENQPEKVAAPPPSANGVSKEAIREFLIESFDNLEQLERDLVNLERDASNEALLNSIFRNIHTIKGTAGFLAFTRVEKITHAAENLLGSLRDGQLVLDSVISTSLFEMIDQVRKYLAAIEREGSEGSEPCEEMVVTLNQLLESRKKSASKSPATVPVTVPATVPTSQSAPSPASPTSSQSQATPSPTLRSSTTPSPVAGNAPASSAGANSEGSGSSATDSTIRVDVALLDKLMTRVGELVLARNQILQFTSALGDSDLLSTSQRLNLITTELQEGVMKTRMQPIGNVWSRFPRLVRDLAAVCGKEVRIEMEGKETELDKTIIEAIKDPLTHLVRNTVDHGIETPSARLERGKPMEGCLYLRAFHEGGQVNIEISDDGAGLHLERIKEKAVEKGLITLDQASRMQDNEVGQLIFLPGFSTAEKISNVSGRGVGMDVVKTNIEKIGGTVDLQSQRGKGTTIKIKIPLTLAIIPALIVTNDGNRFAIPQVNLLELVRLEGEQAQESIEWVQGAPVYRLRGRLLPLVYLRQVLHTERKSKTEADAINIVVLRADDRQFGLVVDRINDTEEIVVKPLSKQLKGVSVYSGATIMGDGKVALILDVIGIAHAAHVISKVRDRSIADMHSRTKDGAGVQQTLLILGTGSTRRLALPISQVARLEKIAKSSVERADQSEVVQYRGEILPLVRLASVLGLEECGETSDELLNVVVYHEKDRSCGLVVDRIVDIVETALEITRPSNRLGLLGAAVIQEHVTDLVDLPAIIRQVQPNLETTYPA